MQGGSDSVVREIEIYYGTYIVIVGNFPYSALLRSTWYSVGGALVGAGLR